MRVCLLICLLLTGSRVPAVEAWSAVATWVQGDELAWPGSASQLVPIAVAANAMLTTAADERTRPQWWWVGRHDQRCHALLASIINRLEVLSPDRQRTAARRILSLRLEGGLFDWALQHWHPTSLTGDQALALCDHPAVAVAQALAKHLGTDAAIRQRLSSHHRVTVRHALGISSAQPVRALQTILAPALDRWRHAMAHLPAPADHHWVRLIDDAQVHLGRARPVIDRGWLLSNDGHIIQLVSWFGIVRRYPADRFRVRRGQLTDAVAVLHRARRAVADRQAQGFDILAAGGSGAARMPPPACYVPECLTTIWLLDQGHADRAAMVLVPLLEATDDDRTVFREGLSSYADVLHQRIVFDCTIGSGLGHALPLAQALSGPAWQGTAIGAWAEHLAADLAHRQHTDHITYRLPTAATWEQMGQRMTRQRTATWLLDHLRLIRQPSSWLSGQGDPRVPQMDNDGKAVINPLVHLTGLELQPADAVDLIPYLEDHRHLGCAIAEGKHGRRLLTIADVIVSLLHAVDPTTTIDLAAYRNMPRRERLLQRQALSEHLLRLTAD